MAIQTAPISARTAMIEQILTLYHQLVPADKALVDTITQVFTSATQKAKAGLLEAMKAEADGLPPRAVEQWLETQEQPR
jgi:hypothetical protein